MIWAALGRASPHVLISRVRDNTGGAAGQGLLREPGIQRTLSRQGQHSRWVAEYGCFDCWRRWWNEGREVVASRHASEWNKDKSLTDPSNWTGLESDFPGVAYSGGFCVRGLVEWIRSFQEKTLSTKVSLMWERPRGKVWAHLGNQGDTFKKVVFSLFIGKVWWLSLCYLDADYQGSNCWVWILEQLGFIEIVTSLNPFFSPYHSDNTGSTPWSSNEFKEFRQELVSGT